MKNIERKSESVKKNILYNICYQMLILILPLITAPYVSRILGAKNVGIYSYTQAIANYFVLFSMLGINNYGNRTIAKYRDDKIKVSKVFWELYIFQLIFSCIMSIIYFVYVFEYIESDIYIYILQYIYILSAAFDVNWFCFGMEKFKITIVRNIIIKLLSTISVFVFVKNNNNLGIYTFIVSMSMLATQIVIWPYIFREVYFIKPKISGIIKHVKPNLLLFVPVLSISLYNIMDKLMLGIFSDSIEVGYYDYAQKIVEVPNSLILAIGTVLMPRISNLIANGKVDVGEKLVEKSILVVMIFSTVFTFGLAAIAPIFTPWFYGEEFRKCGIFIVYLSPIIILKGCAGIIRTQLIIPNEKDNVYILSISLGAIINLITNYLLIPKYYGMGAVIGTIMAEATVCIVQFIKMREYINLRNHIKDEIVFCIFGAIMYFSIIKLQSMNIDVIFGIIIQIILGVIIYGVLLLFYFSLSNRGGIKEYIYIKLEGLINKFN